MMDFLTFFKLGMKRDLHQLIQPGEKQLDVGGDTMIKNSLFTRAAGWDAETMLLRSVSSSSIDTIWCFHFLEHLNGALAEKMLREFERVLKWGGTANIVTPYYTSQMQAHDLDHRSIYCEETWKNLFNDPYYKDHGEWELKVHFVMIAGIVERNLALFTQLLKN